AAPGDHGVDAVRDRVPQRLPDRVPVLDHDRVVDVEAELAQTADEHRTARVGVHTGPGAVGGHDDPGPHCGRSHSPVLPPSLRSTRTPSRTAAGSTALIISMSANPAVATAVSASISTPVLSAVRTVAVIATASGPGSRAPPPPR